MKARTILRIARNCDNIFASLHDTISQETLEYRQTRSGKTTINSITEAGQLNTITVATVDEIDCYCVIILRGKVSQR